jgi:hypothetical protein
MPLSLGDKIPNSFSWAEAMTKLEWPSTDAVFGSEADVASIFEDAIRSALNCE